MIVSLRSVLLVSGQAGVHTYHFNESHIEMDDVLISKFVCAEVRYAQIFPDFLHFYRIFVW